MGTPKTLTTEVARLTGLDPRTIASALGIREHPSGKPTARTISLIRSALREIKGQNRSKEATDGTR
jgi:hypothetical protein